jgi:ketosteroid isomerase-like protein
MAGRGNSELVESFYAKLQAGEIDAVLALLSPDFELVYSGPSIIPSAGTWKGHEGFRNWAQAALRGHLPPEALNFEEFIVQGDKVVVPGHVVLRVKTTGKTCETDFLHLFTLRDGKLVSWRDFFDTFAVAAAYTRQGGG